MALLETAKSVASPARNAIASAVGGSGLGLIASIKTATGLTFRPLDRLIALRGQLPMPGTGTSGILGGRLARSVFTTQSRTGVVTAPAQAAPTGGFRTIGYGR